jgi:hypothetical protein
MAKLVYFCLHHYQFASKINTVIINLACNNLLSASSFGNDEGTIMMTALQTAPCVWGLYGPMVASTSSTLLYATWNSAGLLHMPRVTTLKQKKPDRLLDILKTRLVWQSLSYRDAYVLILAATPVSIALSTKDRCFRK